MESGERLTSSTAAASSTTATSSPASSSPSVVSAVSKGGLSTGAASLSSTINTCGHLFRTAGDQPCNLSTVSSAFPMVSHPVFGLHAASSGHTEFGGLGTLGTPTALAAHPQLAPFPEWWRNAEVHSRTGTAFFPPLIGISPLFAPPAQNHDSTSFHSRTTGKNTRGSLEKGVNGSVNGNSTTSVSGINTSILSTTTASSAAQAKVITSVGGSRKCNQENNKNQILDARADKIKDKKPRKKTVDSSSNSESDSGSSSDTSSEGISSSDSDDLEEDEEEEEDQSGEESEDDDSDSESEAQQKNKNKVLMHSGPDMKADGQKPQEKSQEKRTHQPIPLVSDSQTHPSFQSQQKQPQVLSQQLPFIFQSSQAKEESVNKHTSVIQSTGLVPNVNPLSLVNQAKKETFLKLTVPSPDLLKAGNKNTSEEPSPLTIDVRSNREQYKQTFPAQLKKQHESSKNLKKVITALSNPKPTSSSPAHQKHTSLENNHSNPFLTSALLGNHQPNGVIQSVIQEAPLALTIKSKPHPKVSENVPTSSSITFSSSVNASTCGKKTPSNRTPVMSSTSPVLPGPAKEKAASNNTMTAVKTQHNHPSTKSLAEQFRGVDSDILSSKESEDSNDEDDDDDDEEEEEDEDEEDEDSDDSQSESDSNSEGSDTEGSEDDEEEDDKDPDESETDTEGEKSALKLNKMASSAKSSSINLAACSTPLNLQVAKTPSSAPAVLCPESPSPVFVGTPSPGLTSGTHCGTSKRRRVTDERELRIPLEYGWQRETRIRNFAGRLQGEVAYYAPCGKKLRQYPEVVKYLSRNGIMDISRDNFSFSAKIGVGDFYEARDGPQVSTF